MIDYSNWSDFEINCRVATVLGYKPLNSKLGYKGLQEEENFTAAIVKGKGRLGGFDPCNIPNDAWSIITENQISIDSIYEQGSKWLAFCGDNSEYRYVHSNPLKAAMIVFLKMKEDENENI